MVHCKAKSKGDLLREDLNDWQRRQEILSINIGEHLANFVLAVILTQGKVIKCFNPQIRIHRPRARQSQIADWQKIWEGYTRISCTN